MGGKKCWDFKFIKEGLAFFSDLTEIKANFTIRKKLTYKIFQAILLKGIKKGWRAGVCGTYHHLF